MIWTKDNMNKQDNGNIQLNSLRNEFNSRVKSTLYLGNSKRIKFNDFRRYRTI